MGRGRGAIKTRNERRTLIVDDPEAYPALLGAVSARASTLLALARVDGNLRCRHRARVLHEVLLLLGFFDPHATRTRTQREL